MCTVCMHLFEIFDIIEIHINAGTLWTVNEFYCNEINTIMWLDGDSELKGSKSE